MKRMARHPGGFTLIETLAALVVFGLALTGLVRAIGETSRIQAGLADQRRAMMLAQNVLEELRYSGQFDIGTQEGDMQGEDARFHWRTDVAENEKTVGLLDVGVTIRWNDGQERDFRLITQLADSAATGGGASTGAGGKANSSKAGQGSGTGAGQGAGQGSGQGQGPAGGGA
jgi:type II secretion system protein I